MTLKNYVKLLEKAPPHDSPDFIVFVKDNFPFVYQNDFWLVVEHPVYHTELNPLYYAFHKEKNCEWWDNAPALMTKMKGDWESYGWNYPSKIEQEFTRFYIQIYWSKAKNTICKI